MNVPPPYPELSCDLDTPHPWHIWRDDVLGKHECFGVPGIPEPPCLCIDPSDGYGDMGKWGCPRHTPDVCRCGARYDATPAIGCRRHLPFKKVGS